MTQTISQRGHFGYHYVSLEPTSKSRSETVFDQTTTRVVVLSTYGEDDETVKAKRVAVPDWKVRVAKWPVMQYVICDGEGIIVKRIPLRGSRTDQVEAALLLLRGYAAMEA